MVDFYILTVDTGGTKTQLTLFDGGGEKVSFARCEGMGRLEEKSDGFPFLDESLKNLMKELPYDAVGKIAINVGGKNTEQIRREFEKRFPKACVEAHRESSGVIMSALCDAEKADAILMAGTGTIALAKGKNGNIITDGWCPNVGDFGSGYYIGLLAISRSVTMLEEGAPLSPLCKRITGLQEPFAAFADTTVQMGLRDEVRSRFMPLERSAVAGLSKVVAECAENGDKTAIEIFENAGEQLAKTVIRGLNAVGCEKATVLLSGGLVGCLALWENAFSKALKDANKNHSYRVCESDMTKGALYYAQNNMKRGKQV